MNIKSLLLGTAAALSSVVCAHAADAIVAAEPEPAEYVKVCDAFGSGYFYIPGTETCLKVGGYVRFQVNFNSDSGSNRGWDSFTKTDLKFSAKSESELGALESYAEAIAVDGGSLGIDAAYISLGGFKAGLYYGYWDNGIGENSSWNKTSRFNSIGYSFSNDGISAGFQVDELGAGSSSDSDLGLQGSVSATAGAFTAQIIGAYDTTASETAVKAILSAEAGPGTLALAGIYNTGDNVYYGKKWSVGAAYSIKASDKLTIMPEFQVTRDFADENDWFVGALTSYQIVDGLKASLDVNYNKNESVTGYFRLQRSF